MTGRYSSRETRGSLVQKVICYNVIQRKKLGKSELHSNIIRLYIKLLGQPNNKFMFCLKCWNYHLSQEYETLLCMSMFIVTVTFDIMEMCGAGVNLEVDMTNMWWEMLLGDVTTLLMHVQAKTICLLPKCLL